MPSKRKGRKQREPEKSDSGEETPPSVEEARQLPRLEELRVVNEDQVRQMVLKESDW